MKNTGYTEHYTATVFILIAGALTAALGFLVLLGWALHVPLLTSFGTTIIPMAPSTALFFILLGVALFIHILFPESKFTLLFGICTGSIVSVIALLLFISSSAGIYPHIEHLGFSITSSLNGIAIGQMSQVTAICFFVSALSFLLSLHQSSRRIQRAWMVLVLAFFLILASSLFLVAYLLLSPLMYGGGAIPPSLPTSIAFLILAIGLFIGAGLEIWPYKRMKDAATARDSYVLFLIFIFLASGIITGAFFVFRNYEKNYRVQIENGLSAVADLKVEQLVQWRKERLGDAYVFYRNDVFTGLVKRYFKNPADGDAKKGIRVWMEQSSTAYNYSRICLHDVQGIERLSFPEGPIHPPAIFSIRMSEILKSRKIEFQDFYRDETDKKVYLAVFVPVLDDDNPKNILGVLALRIDPARYLYPMLEKWPMSSRTSETLIIRKDGNDVLYLNDLKFRKDAALNLRIPLDNENILAVKAALGTQGIVEGMDYRGEQVIGYVRLVPDSPWYLVVRMDLEEVYAPLKERLWLMVILVGALLVGAGASVGIVWRHQRSRFYRDQYNAAEALKESEDKFRAIFENSSSAMAIIEKDTTISMVNKEYLNIGLFEEKEIVGSSWTRQIHPEDLERLKEYNRKRLLDPKSAPDHYEFRFFRKDGEIRNALMSVAIIPTIQKIVCSFVDVTERKQAEEVLRKSEERYRSLFENMLNGFAYCQMLYENGRPHDFIYLDVNKAFESLTGLKDVIGKKVSDVIPGIRESDTSLLEIYGRVALTGKPETSEIFVESLKDWYSISVYCPKKGFFVAVFDVITERKRAEEKLKETNIFIDKIINTSSLSTWISDAQGTAIRTNPACLNFFGATEDEVIGKYNVLKDEVIEKRGLMPEIRRVFEKGEVVNIIIDYDFGEVEHVDVKYATHKIINSIFTPILDSTHKVTNVIVQSIDLTERIRAEDMLRETNEYLENLFNYANAPIIVWDPTLVITRFNHAFERLSGYQAEEVKGQRIDILFPEEKISYSIDLIKRAVGGERWETVEIEIQRKDGDSRIVLWNSANVLDKDSKTVVATIAQGHDITERKQAQEVLESQNALLGALINSPSDVIIFSLDRNYCYTTFNERHHEEMLRVWNVEIELGMNLLDCMKIPELHDLAKQSIDRAFNGAIFSEIQHQPDPDIYYEFSWNPIYKGKEITGVTVFIKDITERKRIEAELRKLYEASENSRMALLSILEDQKRAEEKLLESEEQFRTMANAMPQLAWIAKADGYIFWYNQRWYEYTGTTPEQMEGWGWQSVHDPAVLPQVMKNWTGSIASGEPFDMEFPLRGADGQFHTFLTRVRPVRNASGQIVQWFGTNTDIEQLKLAKEEIITLNTELEQRVLQRTSQLEVANKELEAFSYSVSHDLRAPLRHVAGYVNLLGEQYKKDLPQKGLHYLEEITDSVRQMGVLIDDLLKFSRTGRVELRESTVDMNRIVEEILAHIRNDNPQRDIEWSIAPMPPSHCDNTMMHLVWENLLSNAVKFTRTRKAARIEIGVHETNKEFVFFVRDNGVGFDMQYAQKLFGVFQRLHSMAEFEGTGVGLANVHRIIARHGGRTWAEAELDKGATFYFSLPK